MRSVLLAIVITIAGIGCASVPVMIPEVQPREHEVLGVGEGSATGIMLFQFIPIGQNERLIRAYQEAVESRGGDALINPVITERWFWAYVLNGYITTVKGTVIRYKK